MPGPDRATDGGVRADAPVRADRRAQSLDGLGPGLLAAALVIGGLAPLHLLVEPGPGATTLAVLTGSIAVVLAVAWLSLRAPAARALAHRHPQELGVGVGALACLVPAAELLVYPRPASVGGVLVVLLAVGTLNYRRRYALGLTLVCLAQWTAVAAVHGFGGSWGPLTTIVLCTAVLAHVLQVIRCRAADSLARAEVAVLEVAVTDELTGLANRRGLLAAGERLLAGASRPVSVLYLDVDGLKATNDRFGHATGDRLVRATASVLLRQAAPSDVVARLGGDEFAVLLPGVDADAATARREQVQQALTAAGVLASVGTTTAVGARSIGRLLEAADAAMYAVKQQRRALPVPSPTRPPVTASADPVLDHRDPTGSAARLATERLLAAPGGVSTVCLDLHDLARVGAVLHLAVAPAHVLLLPSGRGAVTGAVSVAVAAVFALMLLPPVRRLVPRHACRLLFCALLVLCAEMVVYTAVVDQTWASLVVVLALVGVGGALVRTRQVVLLCGLTTAAWLAVVARPGADGTLPQEVLWSFVTVVAALGVAALLHVSHRRTLARLTAAEAAVRSVALTDELTGLPNRRAFLQAGRPLVELTLCQGGQAGVLFLDLDGLKQVNDRHGHGAGDRLLATAADVLRRGQGPRDLLARLGGDEFTVLVPGCTPAAVPVKIAWLEQALAEHGISASIGAAHLPGDGCSLEGLLDRADEAMLAVKRRRRRAPGAAVPAG